MHRQGISCAMLVAALAACARPSTSPPAPSPKPVPVFTSAEALSSLVPAPIQAACGTPTIDGVISPDEWKNAVKVRFGAILPASVGGGTVPAEIWAMSDATNLYVAYRYAIDTSVYDQSHIIELDANHSGFPDDGDDAWLLTRFRVEAPQFFDDYRGQCLIDGVVQPCAPMDTDPDTGFGQPGTTDGGAAIGSAEGETVVELWHPYHGGDARDVSASPGDLVPLNFQIRLLDGCGDFPRCYGDTYFPRVWEYRPFLLACGAPTPADESDEDIVEVRIEVKPGDVLPTIQLGSDGVTTVAVLGSTAFEVSLVDAATLWFAGAPVALDAAGTPWTSLADVNGDAVLDLNAKFETRALQLGAGDTDASLAGSTVSRRRFHGTDTVAVIP